MVPTHPCVSRDSGRLPSSPRSHSEEGGGRPGFQKVPHAWLASGGRLRSPQPCCFSRSNQVLNCEVLQPRTGEQNNELERGVCTAGVPPGDVHLHENVLIGGCRSLVPRQGTHRGPLGIIHLREARAGQPRAPPSSPGQPRTSDNTAEASLLGCTAIVLWTIVSGPGFVWGCQPKLLTPGAAFEGHPREG